MATTNSTPRYPVFVAKLRRAYHRAIEAEENAETIEDAWRLAEISDRCLADLRAAMAGETLPSKLVVKTLSERARKAWATRRAMAVASVAS